MYRPMLAIAGCVLVAVVLSAWWAWVPANSSGARCKLTRNAAWIDVDWTSKPVQEAAIHQLAESVSDRKIRYLFPYTTFIKPDGSFSPSFGHAPQFVSEFRKYNRDTLLLAWIGIPLKNNRPIGIKGTVDLADAAARLRIVQFAADLIRTSGFDGVHLDAETVPNNDATFLLLLDEMKNAIGQSKISISGSHWVPDWINALPFLRDFRWTSGYYAQVARRSDQIATMTYDSYAPADALYRVWMREQVHGISRAVEQSRTELLIGISVSREETLAHRPNSESLGNGLAGLCAALSDGTTDAQGVAIYGDWEFSDSDQQIWNEWLR